MFIEFFISKIKIFISYNLHLVLPLDCLYGGVTHGSCFHVTGTTHTPNVSEFTIITLSDLGMQVDMSYIIII
jgi:hypothetical protein